MWFKGCRNIKKVKRENNETELQGQANAASADLYRWPAVCASLLWASIHLGAEEK